MADNSMQSTADLNLARYSLAFLWLFTALTSSIFAPEVGFAILESAQITGLWTDVALYGGSTLDGVIGIWLLSNYKMRWCCNVQLMVIAVFTILLTLIDYSFWLHPFGPVTKNIPIVVLIVYMRKSLRGEEP